LCLSARASRGLILAGALGLVLAGCGGDDEESSPPRPPADSIPSPTVPAPVTAPPPETTQEQGDDPPEPRPAPPEEQQGDEEAIRSEAVFTGRGGRLTPREVRVPAFIAIRVILLSADGAPYALRIAGHRLRAANDDRAELELDGLLPNRSYTGRGPTGPVRITASAEPGP
jgi:hypothetical protein